jgi:hypothetical protein
VAEQGRAPVAGDPGIRIGIHDATRFEWVTSVPLPEATTGPQPFAVEFELEVPAQLFVAQDQWRSLQVMSRLQSPSERLDGAVLDTANQDVAADTLRELALSAAHRMKVHGDEFMRECFLANCLISRGTPHHQLERMLVRFQAVENDVAHARTQLNACVPRTPQIESERALVAEFVSNQLLEFHFKARRAIDEHLRREGGPHTSALAETADAFVREVHEPLQREIAYRLERGFLTPTSDDPDLLEHYLERASQLKKHFHELLFLATETSLTDTRLRNYGTIFGAMMASVFGFALNKSGLLGHSASLGLVVAALVGAVVYAMQDKIKELGKTALPTKLGKRYAQRVTRMVVPPRGNRISSKLVGTIEESLTAKLHSRPDPLNPELACRNVHVVRYTSRGVTEAVPELRARGIVSVKQIFRYDLSWLFARLDNARKAVPVLGADGIHVADAPRRYRMPVRVKLALGESCYDHRAIAVMHKGGLERLEFDGDLAPQGSRGASLAQA